MTKTTYWQEYGAPETFIQCWWEYKAVQSPGETFLQYRLKLNIGALSGIRWYVHNRNAYTGFPKP